MEFLHSHFLHAETQRDDVQAPTLAGDIKFMRTSVAQGLNKGFFDAWSKVFTWWLT